MRAWLSKLRKRNLDALNVFLKMWSRWALSGLAVSKNSATCAMTVAGNLLSKTTKKKSRLSMSKGRIPACSKCNHTGKIPFKRKDGSIVPFAFIYCECYEAHQDDRYAPLHVEDIDYPCSHSWRSYFQEALTGKP